MNQDIKISTFWEVILLWSPRILGAILVLAIGFWISNRLVNYFRKTLERSKIDADLVPFLTSVVNVILKFLVVLTAAGVVGIQMTAFAALIAGAGLAIGGAMTGSLGNLSSGVMVLIFKPYRVGDLIKVGDFTGTVRAISVFETILITPENKRIHIPNGTITSGPITNISNEGKIRVDMQFTADAEEDFDHLRNIITMVASQNPKVLSNPGIQVHFKTDNMDKHIIDVWPWCKSEDYWEVYYELQEQVRKEFKSQGIKGFVPKYRSLQ